MRAGWTPAFASDPRSLFDSPYSSFKEVSPVTADRYARIAAALRAKGRPIPTNDVWIAALSLPMSRFTDLQKGEQRDFRGRLANHVKLYSFLAQVFPFLDADLEKLYVFAR